MKWAPIAVVLVFIAISAFWLSSDRELAQHAYADGSSLNTAPAGLSLAHDWLAARGTKVTLLERPLDSIALPANAVVFRVAPSPQLVERDDESFNPLHRRADGGSGGDAGSEDAGSEADAGSSSDAGPSSDAGSALDAGAGLDAGVLARRHVGFDPFQLSPADEAFVRAGGSLVIAATGRPVAPLRDGGAASSNLRDNKDDFVERDELPPGSDDEDDAQDEEESVSGGLGTVEFVHGSAEKVLPILPHVRTLDLPRNRTLPETALIDAQPVFEVDGRPAIARREIGKGQIWLLDTAELFENQHLGEWDHLALFAAMTGTDRPVLFDESVHGVRDQLGMLELLRSWGFIPALLLAVIAGAILFWRRAVTIGPPADDWRDTRSEAIDYVDSAASLFERALIPADSLLLYRAHIVREMSLRLGLTSAEAQRRLDLLMPGKWPLREGEQISAREFHQQLKLFTNALERFRNEHPHQAG